MSDDAKAAPGKKKKGKLTLILLIVTILLLLGGGGAGAFWWMSRGAAAASDGKGGGHEAAHEDDSHATAISLPTFTVNLADRDASRYLRTTLALVVPDADAAAQLTATGHGAGPNVKVMKARSAILEVLATQTAEQLGSPEGKDALKKAISERASKAFGTKVSDVLFSEFVVQF
jgi:flagellar FliL protein